MPTFACPSCGGSLAYSGAAPTVVCQYCGSTVAVLAELRRPGLTLPAHETNRQAMRWLVIFLVLVVGVPTCLGLAGAFLSVAAAVLVPLLALFATFLASR
ncbi:MAG: hypothetical protein IT317_05575 [Anaerolineales bacterium]|nr:hypothetical protein [Anaerolineales bacterium]